MLCALHRHGFTVLRPWMTDNARYDAAIEVAGRLLRVQIKTGSLSADGVTIRFSTRSTNWYSGGQRSYRGEADLFAVYCPELNQTYLLPVDLVPLTAGWIRLKPTRNGQARGVRFATPYALTGARMGELPAGCAGLVDATGVDGASASCTVA